MTTRAAIAFAPKTPLEIVEVDVEGGNWRATASDGAKIVDMSMTGKIMIDPMITHVMGLDDINTAFDLMHAGQSIRSVAVF